MTSDSSTRPGNDALFSPSEPLFDEATKVGPPADRFIPWCHMKPSRPEPSRGPFRDECLATNALSLLQQSELIFRAFSRSRFPDPDSTTTAAGPPVPDSLGTPAPQHDFDLLGMEADITSVTECVEQLIGTCRKSREGAGEPHDAE